MGYKATARLVTGSLGKPCRFSGGLPLKTAQAATGKKSPRRLREKQLNTFRGGAMVAREAVNF